MATEQEGERILKYLKEHGSADSLLLAKEWNEDHQKIVGAVKSLLCLENVIKADLKSSSQWVLTDEGKSVVSAGSHEALVFNAVPAEGGTTQAEIKAKIPSASVGLSKAMSNGWIAVDKSSGAPRIIRKIDKIEDKVQKHLTQLNELDIPLKTEYKKRKLIQEITVKSYEMSPGPSFTTSVKKPDTDLTPEMISSGSWKEKTFKPYNLKALGVPITRGHLHPLMKVRSEFRQIFLEMGFSEMPTNNFVESSFWNFDALFQPQQHPARDAHDTFFISDPSTAKGIPQDYMERVKKVHSVGGYGSQGYGYDWKIEEAQKNLLRTHTTAVSARMLYKLAQEKEFKPAKYFSIDRVFRNETLDATHLAEFHQVEGVVADRGLSLGHLIGILNEFFRKLGMTKLRFKPAYNPYTEPSMEVFSFHPGLNKWIEIGNSGVFRPEMLLPMGLPEDVSVIAWGLSLERPTMIKYGYNNIRDLVGPKVNLQMVADNPLCRLDKHRSIASKEPNEIDELEKGMDSIMKRLLNLQAEVNVLKKRKTCQEIENLTLIIEADPRYPPQSLRHMIRSLISAKKIRISVTLHRHSTLLQPLMNDLADWLPSPQTCRPRSENQLNVTWIWKQIGCSPVAKTINPSSGDLHGQAAIARLLARLTESWTGVAFYEEYGSSTSAEIDDWIDESELVNNNSSRSTSPMLLKRIQGRLSSADWLVGPGRGVKSLADVFLASLFYDQLRSDTTKSWLSRSTSS